MKFLIFGFLLGLPLPSGAEDKIADYVYPPHSQVENLSLGEWSSRWWQWAYTHQGLQSPVNDPTGEMAAIGQDEQSPVWFLAGSFGTVKVVRHCVIPSGRPIFLPLVNFISRGARGGDCEQTRQQCRKMSAGLSSPYFKLDGQSLPNAQDYVEQSDNCFDIPIANMSNLIAGGYWVMLKPLPPGEHVLEFGAVMGSRFSQTIEYHIVIQGPQPTPAAAPAIPVMPPDSSQPTPVDLSPLAFPEWIPASNANETITFQNPPVEVYFTFADGPGRYQVEVVDGAGNPLETIFNRNVTDAEAEWLEWDGLDGKGRDVPLGRYYVVLYKGTKALKSILLVRVP